jgi:tRNA pseudouridine38-40 synthase
VYAPVDLPTLYVCGLVSYDGTDYHGFQYQQGLPTIQAALERALHTISQAPGRVVGAGRTDGGVHARGQVIATTVRWRHGLAALQRAWNVNLPDSIVVRQLQMAPSDFHPRFSAVSRTYRYTLYAATSADRSAPQRAPLTDRFATYVAYPLDLASMQTAAQCLLGEHDFATFGRATEGESTVRHVYQAEWQAVEDTLPCLSSYPARRLVFTIRANGFLYQMVRNLVGSLIKVGLGERSPAEIIAALQARARSCSAPPAPPQGLVLERVTYPEQLGLQLD